MRSYPKYDLDNSVEAARTLHTHGGQASALELAAILGYGGTNNGAYLNRVAAARAFGMIEGEGRGAAIRVSRRALDIIVPDNPASEARARLEAFTAVPLYAEFLDRYEGQPLPDGQGLRNALVSMGIPANSARLALARLRSSAQQAGLFNVSSNKMIRPTMVARSIGEPVVSSADEAVHDAVRSNRYSKLIDGMIEELPANRDWTEDGMVEWLDLFQRALRIHYHLPRPRGGGGDA
jgi:hypothetical protein